MKIELIICLIISPFLCKCVLHKRDVIPPAFCQSQDNKKSCYSDCRCTWCHEKSKCYDAYDIKSGKKSCSDSTFGDQCGDDKWVIYFLLAILGVASMIIIPITCCFILFVIFYLIVWCCEHIPQKIYETKDRILHKNEGIPLRDC